MSIEVVLADLLRTEVDKRVAAVQAAADAWVASFKAHAEALIKNPGVAVTPTLSAVIPVAPEDEHAAFLAAKSAREATKGQTSGVTYTVTDEAAAKANMSV